MNYELDKIKAVFQLYSEMMYRGEAPKEVTTLYQSDIAARELMDAMAEVMECEIFPADRKLYLIPRASDSLLSISNQELLKRYFPASFQNKEIYTLYFALMVLVGEFYDSDTSMRPTREFVSIDHWIHQISLLLDSLKNLGKETLEQLEKDQEVNWLMIIDKWDSLDTYREDVVEKKRAASKYAFMETVKNFLIKQEVLEDVGADEVTLTEKAKVIVSRYYMNTDYNRELMSFIYGLKEGLHE